MNQTTTEISAPITKTALAWGSAGASSAIPAIAHGLGISNWAEAAQFVGFVSGCLASLLTCCYLVDWFLKRVWRPVFVLMGWRKAAEAVDLAERE